MVPFPKYCHIYHCSRAGLRLEWGPGGVSFRDLPSDLPSKVKGQKPEADINSQPAIATQRLDYTETLKD